MKILLNDKFKKGTTEYLIIELVNSNPIIFKEKTINEISDLLFINASSLSRAIKRMGWSNYKDFRDYVVLQFEEIKEIKHLNFYEDTSELINNFKYLNKFTIEETINGFSLETLDEIIDKVLNSRKVYLYGIGYSNYMCRQLDKHMSFMGINSKNIETFYDALKFMDTSSELEEQDVWIIISKSLTTKEICFVLEELHESKKEIIVITSNDKAKQFKYATNYLLLKTMFEDDWVYSMNTKMSLLVFTNLFTEILANKLRINKKDRVSALKHRVSKWKKYNI